MIWLYIISGRALSGWPLYYWGSESQIQYAKSMAPSLHSCLILNPKICLQDKRSGALQTRKRTAHGTLSVAKARDIKSLIRIKKTAICENPFCAQPIWAALIIAAGRSIAIYEHARVRNIAHGWKEMGSEHIRRANCSGAPYEYCPEREASGEREKWAG